VAGLLACAILAVAMTGCSAGRADLTTIADADGFDRQVCRAQRPVLVEFYKDSCPTCVLQEACLKELALEYGDRVLFARFKIRERTMRGSCPEIMDRYDLFWVPTVILFENGIPTQRWVLNHPTWAFRRALDRATGATGDGEQLAEDDPFSDAYLMGAPPDKAMRCVDGVGCRIAPLQ
jgi:thioredoxin-like negative regulator of GroEL